MSFTSAHTSDGSSDMPGSASVYRLYNLPAASTKKSLADLIHIIGCYIASFFRISLGFKNPDNVSKSSHALQASDAADGSDPSPLVMLLMVRIQIQSVCIHTLCVSNRCYKRTLQEKMRCAAPLIFAVAPAAAAAAITTAKAAT
jgi:hypothetical protein